MNLKPVEQKVVEKFNLWGGILDVKGSKESPEKVVYTGLVTLLHMGRLLREARRNPQGIIVSYKQDATRVTDPDVKAEQLARSILGKIFPDDLVVGEENGGELDPHRRCWIVDPIDSTNTFLSYENTSAISLGLMHEGKMLFSAVYNPFTGEIFYVYGEDRPRLIQHNGIGEVPTGYDLPLPQIEKRDPYRFVNIHPVQLNDALYSRFIQARTQKRLDKVLQRGGSPALSLASIPKDLISFVHQWDTPAKPWDLAAGIDIVRKAGGLVTGPDGVDIPLVGYQGLFVASHRREFHDQLLELINTL